MQMMILALTNCALSIPKEPRNLLNIQLQQVATNHPCEAEHELSASTKCAEHVVMGGPTRRPRPHFVLIEEKVS